MTERIQTFDPSNVHLLPGHLRDRQELNTRYLLELEPDRLLHAFRLQGGLPTLAEPLGGWESPDCGLRGHFVGHYLSACAQGYAATGDIRLKDRAGIIVAGFAACQDTLGTGYLSAFSESQLDVIEKQFDGAWAPYYTLHKILAGLVDAYRFCGFDQALQIASRLGEYLCGRIQRLTPEQIEGMCRTDRGPNPSNEFGGISEPLQHLAEATGCEEFDQLARVFERDWFTEPLVRDQDCLTGLHANTHVAMVLALACRYERTGEPRLRKAVSYFWDRIVPARTYVNGGSSGPHPGGNEKSKGAEHWPAPYALAGTLTPKINESCVTHNMLRLSDALFRWTGDDRYADYRERAFLNHVLAIQNPNTPGEYLYDHPLSPRSRKKYGSPLASFWCCYGSSVEAFERLADAIYFHCGDVLWVNQFIASELSWDHKGVRIRQQTRFPDEPMSRLTVQCSDPVELEMRIRIPRWTKGAQTQVNDLAAMPASGPYQTIRRVWLDGDRITVTTPMSLFTEAMPDDADMFAFRYGPLVLAADSELDLVVRNSERPRSLPDQVFQIPLSNGAEVRLVPLSRIAAEPFGVYFRR